MHQETRLTTYQAVAVVRGTSEDFGKQDVLAKGTEQRMLCGEKGVVQEWRLEKRRKRMEEGEEEEEKALKGTRRFIVHDKPYRYRSIEGGHGNIPVMPRAGGGMATLIFIDYVFYRLLSMDVPRLRDWVSAAPNQLIG